MLHLTEFSPAAARTQGAGLPAGRVHFLTTGANRILNLADDRLGQVSKPSTDTPKQPEISNRQTPFSTAFKEFIAEGWAPHSAELPAALPASAWTKARQQRVLAAFPGETLVIPAGPLKVRSNDTDFRYRPHAAFAHLSGLGEDREPDSVLVLHADARVVFYFKPRAPRTDPEFYASARYGEMWVGQRESLDEMAALTRLECRPIEEFFESLDASSPIRVMPGVDETITSLVNERRGSQHLDADRELEVMVSELRLVKDEFEIGELRSACEATAVGFEAVIADLPEAVRRGRGERWVEGIFGLHSRHLGNAVGYDTIAASGDHANTLHWIRNDGDLRDGDLILLDAGVEVASLYTADVTRTLPVTGRFSPAQREVYQAVYEAQQAGIAAARPGVKMFEVHQAAIRVIATWLERWGILPVSVEESLSATGGQHRRWMVHGTSHHLGIDVHDCAQARNEHYREGTLAPGMVITVEPGIYFKSTDLLVPEKFRGIGVRIEDDILITVDGSENLSAMLPRRIDEVEAWIAQIWTKDSQLS